MAPSMEIDVHVAVRVDQCRNSEEILGDTVVEEEYDEEESTAEDDALVRRSNEEVW